MSEKPPLCDWMEKPSFGECLEVNFVGKDISLIEDFLSSQGFLTLKIQEQSSPRYYQKASNDVSGYKVAVIIEFTPNGTLASVQIR